MVIFELVYLAIFRFVMMNLLNIEWFMFSWVHQWLVSVKIKMNSRKSLMRRSLEGTLLCSFVTCFWNSLNKIFTFRVLLCWSVMIFCCQLPLLNPFYKLKNHHNNGSTSHSQLKGRLQLEYWKVDVYFLLVIFVPYETYFDNWLCMENKFLWVFCYIHQEEAVTFKFLCCALTLSLTFSCYSSSFFMVWHMERKSIM